VSPSSTGPSSGAGAASEPEFELYDLRIEVVGPPDHTIYCGARLGDYFELHGEMLKLPPGQGFSIYSWGVLAGGWLADRAGLRGGLPGKLRVCLVAGALILPVAASIDAAHLSIVLLSIPAYFALSGIVTACGFSAILDAVPNRSRGLAMSISFFLNVAVGGAVGPTAVALASDHVFGSSAGLGPAIAVTVAVAYGLAVIALLGALRSGSVSGR
jgi:MFS family permease